MKQLGGKGETNSRLSPKLIAVCMQFSSGLRIGLSIIIHGEL